MAWALVRELHSGYQGIAKPLVVCRLERRRTGEIGYEGREARGGEVYLAQWFNRPLNLVPAPLYLLSCLFFFLSFDVIF